MTSDDSRTGTPQKSSEEFCRLLLLQLNHISSQIVALRSQIDLVERAIRELEVEA